MREVLFRGKRITDGKWVYGSFCMDALEQKNGLCGVDGFIRLYDHIEGKMQMYEVDRETVCQYTGLTDKNGSKIFEGDIVRYGETVHEVVFEQRNGTAYFGLVYSPLETLPFGHYQDLKQIEIIGNIHENPELLEIP